MKNYISKLIAYSLPNRVMLWCIVRAYGYTTVHSHSDLTPDDIGYSLLYESWDYKTRWLLNDRKDNFVEFPKLKIFFAIVGLLALLKWVLTGSPFL